MIGITRNGNGNGEDSLSPEDRRHKATVRRAAIWSSGSAIVGMVAIVLPVLGWLAGPRVIQVVADGVAPIVLAQANESLDHKLDGIDKKVSPLSQSFKVLLQQNIRALSRDIAELERIQASSGLTAVQARQLADKRQDLRDQEMALAAMEKAQED